MTDNGLTFQTQLNDEEWKLTAYFHSFGTIPGIQYPAVGNLISTKVLFEQAMCCMIQDFERFIARTKEVFKTL